MDQRAAQPSDEPCTTVNDFLNDPKHLEAIRQKYGDDNDLVCETAPEKVVARCLTGMPRSVIRYLNFLEAAKAFKDYPDLLDKYFDKFLGVIDSKFYTTTTDEAERLKTIAEVQKHFAIRLSEDTCFKEYVNSLP